MEYVYAAMLLHKAGQTIDETSLKKVLEAASVKVDEAKIKALVASLEGVNIEEAIEKAASVAAAPTAAPAAQGEETPAKEDNKKEDKKEEEKKPEESAAGLGALFG